MPDIETECEDEEYLDEVIVDDDLQNLIKEKQQLLKWYSEKNMKPLESAKIKIKTWSLNESDISDVGKTEFVESFNKHYNSSVHVEEDPLYNHMLLASGPVLEARNDGEILEGRDLFVSMFCDLAVEDKKPKKYVRNKFNFSYRR